MLIPDKIAIIMATYNGEKFIIDQINSILTQTYTNWELYIFDDMSTDNTCKIIQSFCINDIRIKLYQNNYNFGATHNFLQALNFVNSFNKFEYYMFCDQDDIWLPNKIELLYKKIIKEGKNSKILLVHSDLSLVDETGNNVIAKSFRKYAHLKHIENYVFERLLAQPFVFGCTTIFNKTLVEQLYPIPKNIYAHDSWLSLIAASLGKILYIQETTINYRQHSSNLSGSPQARKIKNRLKRITTGWKEQIFITNKRLLQCEDLLYYIQTNTQYYEILKKYCNACRTNTYTAIKTSIQLHILRQGFFANVFYFITLMFIKRNKND
jgi:glycosyltransferase involved in cell wall biosynthesis